MKKIFLGLFILLSIFCFSATPSKTKRGESMELIFIMTEAAPWEDWRQILLAVIIQC